LALSRAVRSTVVALKAEVVRITDISRGSRSRVEPPI
jgi:hypothetical protein